MGIGEILSSAFKTLITRLGETIKTYLAYALILFVLSFITNILKEVSVIKWIAAIGLIIVQVPLQFGLIKQFILLYNEKYVEPFGFIRLGFEKFGMSWRVTGRMFLKLLVPIILILIAQMILIQSGLNMVFGGGSATGSIFGSVLMIIAIILTIIQSLKYMFAYNELAYDEATYTGKEILETVKQNMEGNKVKLILTYIAILVISALMSLLVKIPIIGIIITIVAVILFVPYSQYVAVAFYEGIRGDCHSYSSRYSAVGRDSDNQGPIKM